LLFGTGEEKSVYNNSLHGFHGALTQLIREHSLGTNMYENQRITKFIDNAKPQNAQ